jgi:hypothetical protein
MVKDRRGSNNNLFSARKSSAGSERKVSVVFANRNRRA